MDISFDRNAFRSALKRHLQFVLRHDASALVEEVINELIHERLVELAEEELNGIAENTNDAPLPLEKTADKIAIEISPLDIDHRYLVREVLKRHLKKALRDYIRRGLT